MFKGLLHEHWGNKRIQQLLALLENSVLRRRQRHWDALERRILFLALQLIVIFKILGWNLRFLLFWKQMLIRWQGIRLLDFGRTISCFLRHHISWKGIDILSGTRGWLVPFWKPQVYNSLVDAIVLQVSIKSPLLGQCSHVSYVLSFLRLFSFISLCFLQASVCHPYRGKSIMLLCLHLVVDFESTAVSWRAIYIFLRHPFLLVGFLYLVGPVSEHLSHFAFWRLLVLVDLHVDRMPKTNQSRPWILMIAHSRLYRFVISGPMQEFSHRRVPSCNIRQSLNLWLKHWCWELTLPCLRWWNFRLQQEAFIDDGCWQSFKAFLRFLPFQWKASITLFVQNALDLIVSTLFKLFQVVNLLKLRSRHALPKMPFLLQVDSSWKLT